MNEIVKRCKAKQLMELYQIPRFSDANDFLKQVALSRGKLKKASGSISILLHHVLLSLAVLLATCVCHEAQFAFAFTYLGEQVMSGK